MKGLTSFAVVVVAILFGVYAVPSHAASAEPKGEVKGKVLKADGKPAAGAMVRLMPRAARAKRGVQPTAAAPDGAKAKAGRKPAERRGPAASATADLNGEFTLSDVPAGQYVVAARAKGAGNARQPVTVHAGKPADVTLTLKAADPTAAKHARKRAKADAKPAAAKAKTSSKKAAA